MDYGIVATTVVVVAAIVGGEDVEQIGDVTERVVEVGGHLLEGDSRGNSEDVLEDAIFVSNNIIFV